MELIWTSAGKMYKHSMNGRLKENGYNQVKLWCFAHGIG